MPLTPVSLDDKYDLTKERVFVTGFQALVRLTLMQKERDRRAGLNTAGYRHRLSRLAARHARSAVPARVCNSLPGTTSSFIPATNEDLAATALSGLAAGRVARRRQVR